MNDLLAAADVLVHSTGGVTCLEALARGCPIVAYGAPPGHAPLLAKTMSNLGLLVYASSAAELGAALRAARRQSAPLPRGRDAATLVLGVVPRVVVRFRARLARTAAAACTLVVALFVFLASDATYPLVAEALGLPDTTSVVSHRRAVALVVQGRRTDVLALAAIRSRRFSASVAVPERLSRADVLTLRAAGLDPIPALRTGGISSWPDASGQLLQQARRYGTARSFYYLAPREGFTFANYLLGWNINGRPIQAGLVLASGDHHLPRTVHRGEVVVADLGAGAADRERLLAAVGLLEQRGFAVSSVQGLTSGGHGT
jgi:hypothetical protein